MYAKTRLWFAACPLALSAPHDFPDSPVFCRAPSRPGSIPRAALRTPWSGVDRSHGQDPRRPHVDTADSQDTKLEDVVIESRWNATGAGPANIH